jgi:predicted RNA-binding protein YlqC (UPF0109 family)
MNIARTCVGDLSYVHWRSLVRAMAMSPTCIGDVTYVHLKDVRSQSQRRTVEMGKMCGRKGKNVQATLKRPADVLAAATASLRVKNPQIVHSE